MNKKEMRQKVLHVLDEMSEETRKKKNNMLMDMIVSNEDVKTSSDIMCFVSFRNEVDTHGIIKKLILMGKNVYIPYIDTNKNIMKISKLESFDELEEGYYGILEPKKDFLRITPGNVVDTVITPGVVFDKYDYRIGYGGGFYDKFFAVEGKDAKKIGLCYTEQIVDKVPREKFDIKLDYIIHN